MRPGRDDQDRLDHIRIGAVGLGVLLGHDGGDVATRLVGQQLDAGVQHLRADERHVALQIDHHVVGPVRIQLRQGRQDAVGSGRQPRVGQHRPAAGGGHRPGDLRIAGRHGHVSGSGAFGATHDPDDHGHAVDVGQRLAGQPRGGHARRDDHDRIHRAEIIRTPLDANKFAANPRAYAPERFACANGGLRQRR